MLKAVSSIFTITPLVALPAQPNGPDAVAAGDFKLEAKGGFTVNES